MTDGYPLNAEDMTATLGSFCVPPIVASLKIGSPMPLRMRMAYISKLRLLRHIYSAEPQFFRSLETCRLLLGSAQFHSQATF